MQLPAGDTYARSATDAPETVDALFHLPLLAMAIMTIARREKFQTMNLGGESPHCWWNTSLRCETPLTRWTRL